VVNQQSAWEQLSAETAQVLFCDLQKVTVRHSQTSTPKALASAAGALLQLAKIFSLPVVVSVVPDGSDSQVIAELDGAESFGPKLLRTTNSLFSDPPTLQVIERSGRKVRRELIGTEVADDEILFVCCPKMVSVLAGGSCEHGHSQKEVSDPATQATLPVGQTA
jgi:hypothetical protein